MKLKRHSFFIVFTSFALLLFIFCKAKRIKTEAMLPVEKTAFYTMNASRDSALHKTVFTVKNITVTDVKARYTIDEARTKEPNYLKIEITYDKNRIVQAIIEHPLYKRLETSSESGQLESKLISLQQSDFVFRVPYYEPYKKIKIVEFINFKEQPLTTLKNEK